MKKNKIHIAGIQEIKFTSKSKLRPTLNFTLIRKNRDKDQEEVLPFSYTTTSVPSSSLSF